MNIMNIIDSIEYIVTFLIYLLKKSSFSRNFENVHRFLKMSGVFLQIMVAIVITCHFTGISFSCGIKKYVLG